MGKLIDGWVDARAGYARIDLSPRQAKALLAGPAPTSELTEKEKHVFDLLMDAGCRLTGPRICQEYHTRTGEQLDEGHLRKSIIPVLRKFGVTSAGKRGYGITARPE